MPSSRGWPSQAGKQGIKVHRPTNFCLVQTVQTPFLQFLFFSPSFSIFLLSFYKLLKWFFMKDWKYGLEKAQDHQCKKSKRRSSKPSAASQASLDIWVSLGNVQGEKKAYQPWQIPPCRDHQAALLQLQGMKTKPQLFGLQRKWHTVVISNERTDRALKLPCYMPDSSSLPSVTRGFRITRQSKLEAFQVQYCM